MRKKEEKHNATKKFVNNLLLSEFTKFCGRREIIFRSDCPWAEYLPIETPGIEKLL